MSNCSLLGFGWHFTPRAPFEFGRLVGGDVVVVHHGAKGQSKARLSPAGGRMQFALAPGTQSLDEVLLDHGPTGGEPSGRCLDEMLYIQGPYLSTEIPGPEELRRPDMELVARTRHPGRHGEVEAVEFRYRLQGATREQSPTSRPPQANSEDWRQWRIYVPLGESMELLLTAQATADGRDSMQALALEAATLLRGRWT